MKITNCNCECRCIGVFSTNEEALEWKNHMLNNKLCHSNVEWSISDYEPILPTYDELRKKRYISEIDPLLSEALLDSKMGDDTKLNELIAKKAQIKLDIPKPV